MILHIISKSPFHSNVFYDACSLISAGDHIILIDDGTYACLENPDIIEAISASNANWHALDTDLATRGIPMQSKLVENIAMQDFVKLVLESDKTLSWY